ncbi:M23 family metallopeptidase [Demequina sp. NBRC 110057]|uniref:M23 family metallopeptidase n=1 Tax=Demequina sp. NBRC 110057 TaxID=1570346 RepID=UPI000A075E58|nr:M23 family metallopeptidase [Demequina sp. NBRC 110057]
MPIAIARCRVPAIYLSLTLVVAGLVLVIAGVWGPPTMHAGHLAIIGGLALFALAFLATVVSPRVHGDRVPLAPPVLGEWTAVASPSSRRPSLGTHAWGQTYAMTVVYSPTGVERPRFADGTGALLGPGRFPGFGQPVLAPADGVVAHVTDGARDHRSRSSRLARVWMLFEGAARELGGPRAVFGNHVVIRLEDGTHVVLAHLRRGSLRVQQGSTVTAGQVIAACGNSGHSAEPQVHLHRQDLESPYLAAGLPWDLDGQAPPRAGEAIAPRAPR